MSHDSVTYTNEPSIDTETQGMLAVSTLGFEGVHGEQVYHELAFEGRPWRS